MDENKIALYSYAFCRFQFKLPCIDVKFILFSPVKRSLLKWTVLVNGICWLNKTVWKTLDFVFVLLFFCSTTDSSLFVFGDPGSG